MLGAERIVKIIFLLNIALSFLLFGYLIPFVNTPQYNKENCNWLKMLKYNPMVQSLFIMIFSIRKGAFHPNQVFESALTNLD